MISNWQLFFLILQLFLTIIDKVVPPSVLDRERKSKLLFGGNEGKRKKTFHLNSDPTMVSVQKRLTEFENQSFREDRGKLFCDCCCSVVALKKSSIQNHCITNNNTKYKLTLSYKMK